MGNHLNKPPSYTKTQSTEIFEPSLRLVLKQGHTMLDASISRVAELFSAVPEPDIVEIHYKERLLCSIPIYRKENIKALKELFTLKVYPGNYVVCVVFTNKSIAVPLKNKHMDKASYVKLNKIISRIKGSEKIRCNATVI